MDKIKMERPCSPYLRRPLRSLDEALKDQADVVRRNNERLLAEPDPITRQVLRDAKKAS
ncbi:MAG: hypothetical protein QF384_21430 [Alphaproteobacteria bacterium]|jgi:hypothetical protein|nr:hypothetical protein [Alphaproteobacteria bacterium]MDP6830872.1 hypothetical protein [Alphaproteobacteria bacterium]MDP6876389.1 hypothetical protein [Alphaproteobacteria bacterium]